MTKNQTAAMLQAGMQSLEGFISELPDGDEKSSMIHHAARAHFHLNVIANAAVGGNHIRPLDGDPKP